MWFSSRLGPSSVKSILSFGEHLSVFCVHLFPLAYLFIHFVYSLKAGSVVLKKKKNKHRRITYAK